MRGLGTGTKTWLLSSAILFNCSIVFSSAQATSAGEYVNAETQPIVTDKENSNKSRLNRAFDSKQFRNDRVVGRRAPTYAYGISCVPYARQASGIMVVGNAWQWWDRAAGHYARGDLPEPGSVLNFRPNGRMTLGHVAVVTRVVNAREVIIDHANWPNGAGRGKISRNVAAVDVSLANNWSAVRVELRVKGTFGSVYPTYGFIYNRPDSGFVTASITRPAPQPDINPVPSDLRPKAERPWQMIEEVAESRDTPSDRRLLRVIPASSDR